jgi:hypothetical protein
VHRISTLLLALSVLVVGLVVAHPSAAGQHCKDTKTAVCLTTERGQVKVLRSAAGRHTKLTSDAKRPKPTKSPRPRTSPTATASPTPSPTSTATPTPSPTSTATATSVPAPTATPTTSPSPTPTTVTGLVPPVAKDCSVDVAAALNSWLATVPNGSTVNLADGCYRVESVLELTGRTLTIRGGTLRSLNPPADQRAMWRFWNSTITLQDLTLDGSYASGGTYSGAVEHAHAIDLRGTDAALSNLTMTDFGGDCVYFGLGADRSTGSLTDSSCARIGRNGVSVTAGDDITVTRTAFDRIGFIGVDIEPNVGAGWGSDNVTVTASTFGAVHLRVWSVIANAPVSHQTFTGNTINAATGDAEMTVGDPRTGLRPADVTVTDNVSTMTQVGPAVDIYDNDRGIVTGNRTVGGSVARITNSTGMTVCGNSTGSTYDLPTAC